MRKILIPLLTTMLIVAAMVYQAKTVEPVLCDPPSVRLGEIAGLTSETLSATEAERHVLPEDTRVERKLYTAPDGAWFNVTLVVGGRSKSSIHRPEMCLPAQGFQMMSPRDLEVGGTDWHVVDLMRRGAPKMSFAYTFFNQEGFRTASHVQRIFRDIWDRSIRGRIDRWAMVTVHASVSDDRRMEDLLSQLKGVVGP